MQQKLTISDSLSVDVADRSFAGYFNFKGYNAYGEGCFTVKKVGGEPRAFVEYIRVDLGEEGFQLLNLLDVNLCELEHVLDAKVEESQNEAVQ